MKKRNFYFIKVFILIVIFFNNNSVFGQEIVFNYQGEILLNNTNIINEKIDAKLVATALNKKFKVKKKRNSNNVKFFKYNFRKKGIKLHGTARYKEDLNKCFLIKLDFKKNKKINFKLFDELLNSDIHFDKIYQNEYLQNYLLKNQVLIDFLIIEKTGLHLEWSNYSIHLTFNQKSKLLETASIKIYDKVLRKIYNF